jgi:hypothetical protein
MCLPSLIRSLVRSGSTLSRLLYFIV